MRAVAFVSRKLSSIMEPVSAAAQVYCTATSNSPALPTSISQEISSSFEVQLVKKELFGYWLLRRTPPAALPSRAGSHVSFDQPTGNGLSSGPTNGNISVLQAATAFFSLAVTSGSSPATSRAWPG